MIIYGSYIIIYGRSMIIYGPYVIISGPYMIDMVNIFKVVAPVRLLPFVLWGAVGLAP